MSYSSEVLADSPWGCYGQAETSGTTLADYSGNGRTLTITGAPTLAQLGPDGATSDAIAWPSSASTEHYAASAVSVSTTTCTCEAWVYLAALPTAPTPLVATAVSYGNNAQRIALYVDAAGKVDWMTYRGGDEAVHVVSPSALALGAWHHVVASIGPAGAKIRIDKTTVKSDAGTAISAGAELLFLRGGGNSGGNPNLTNGSAVTIARPAFYTTQLSDTRTDAHYDAATPPPAPTGTIGAVLPALSASLSGGITFSGPLAATLPALAANLTGTSTIAGVAGNIAATLPGLTADIVGSYAAPIYSGTLDATLPNLAANISGQAFEPGVGGFLAGLLPALSASLSADVIGRAGLGLILDSDAAVIVEPPLATETTPAGTPSTALHIAAPTVPVPTLVAGRPQ